MLRWKRAQRRCAIPNSPPSVVLPRANGSIEKYLHPLGWCYSDKFFVVVFFKFGLHFSPRAHLQILQSAQGAKSFLVPRTSPSASSRVALVACLKSINHPSCSHGGSLAHELREEWEVGRVGKAFWQNAQADPCSDWEGQKKEKKNWGHSSLCVVCCPHAASSDGWSLLLGEVWGHQSQNGWCQGGPFLGLIRDWPESPFQNNKNRMQFCRLKNTNMIFVSLETVPVHDVDYNTVCTFIFPQNIQSGPCQSSLTFSPRHIF